MKPYPKYFDWLRYACALLLYFYGLSKIAGHQLNLPAEVGQKPIGSLNGFLLTWYYYGYSHTYRIILGLTQITGASLLLFRKSALLAALLMTPIMANILLINVFYSITAGAEWMALFILGCMLMILWHERKPLFGALWVDQSTEPDVVQKKHWITRALILLFALVQLAVGTLLDRK